MGGKQGSATVIPDASDVDFISDSSNTSNPNDTSLQDFIDSACAASASQKPGYLGNGELDNVEFFSSATQIQANRTMRVDVTYSGALDPTSEAWKMYDIADGTTILKTVTFTHTWVSGDLTKSVTTVT